MKNMILMTAIVAVLSVSAQATEICGTIGSHTVGPKCAPGVMCPHFFTLQYELTEPNGAKVEIETEKLSLLQTFGKLNGKEVCTKGQFSRNKFSVTSITVE
jgi:hypothetical protein